MKSDPELSPHYALPSGKIVSPDLPHAIDTSNAFAVGLRGDGLLVFWRPVMCVVTKAEALNLAAWLSVLADPSGGEEFERIVREIKNT